MEACGHAHISSPAPTSNRSGAAQASRCLIDSEPRITTQTLAVQKMRKPRTSPTPPSCVQPSESRRQQQVHGNPAEQRLDAEPSAGHQRANQRRDVGADDPERGTQHDREWNAELGAAEGVEDQRYQHDDVGDEYRPQRLADGQTEVRRQHAAQRVGRHADRHADPQCGDVPPVPGALRDTRRRNVLVEARARSEVRADFELVELADLHRPALCRLVRHQPCTSEP